MVNELGPMLAAESPEHGGECPRIFKRCAAIAWPRPRSKMPSGISKRSAKAFRSRSLLGGVRETIPCGVSLGIQASIPELLAIIERELAAGYQRIKLKCKPGWDVEVFERVRNRWPGIMLSCDANSAYRLRDADHLVSFDAFDLLMIEQPLWHDDFYFHSDAAKAARTRPSASMNPSATGATRWRPSRWSRARSSTSSWAAWADSPRPSPCTTRRMERGIPVWCGGMLESGIGRSHNIALSTLENFTLPGDVSASARYWADDIIEPEVTVSPQGEIAIPDTPGRGYEVRTDLIESSPCARKPSAPWRWWRR